MSLKTGRRKQELVGMKFGLVARQGVMVVLALFSIVTLAKAPVLVSPEWVQKKLNNPAYVIVDMSDQIQYQRFHIPGAVNLPYSVLNRRRKDKVVVRVPDPVLYRILGLSGISANTHVIIYDDFGGLHAGRLFWELERIGHRKVSVLNGGIVSWVLQKRPVTNQPTRHKPVSYVPDKSASRRENDINFAQFRELDLKKTVILDVRSRDEYTGHPKYPRTGHVPGARWWQWSDSVDFKQAFKLHAKSKLLNSLKKIGITDVAKEVVLYCRTGHRASQSYLVLRSLGFSKVRLFDGSILEYTSKPKVVLKKGLQP